MNAERLHAIALSIRFDLDETKTLDTLRALRDALQNQVGAPQEPTHQQAVSTNLQTLLAALDSAPSNAFPTTWLETLDELGFDGLLGTSLGDQVRAIFERNQITPSVAAEELDEFVTELAAHKTALDQLIEGMSHFEVGHEDLNPGEAELSILIPRLAVGERLRSLGLEFVDLEKLVGPFAELATGRRPEVRVRSIASSDYGVFLDIAPQAAAFMAVAVERVVALYKQLLEIRRLRQEMSDQGVTEDGLSGIDAHANELMSAGIEELADELADSTSVVDQHRSNELKIELRLSLNSIANKIDQGYSIDVRSRDEAVKAHQGVPSHQLRHLLLSFSIHSKRLQFAIGSKIHDCGDQNNTMATEFASERSGRGALCDRKADAATAPRFAPYQRTARGLDAGLPSPVLR